MYADSAIYRGTRLPQRVKKNIVLIGDGAVGKTSLIRRFVLDKFSDEYIITVGAKVTKKEMQLDHRGEAHSLTLMIWDVLGQEGYSRVQTSAYENAEAAMVVADLTRKETLDNLRDYWIPALFDVAGEIPVVFLANKSDLEDERQFGLEEVRSLAATLKGAEEDAPCFLTSAKSGDGVEGAFLDVAQLVMDAGDRISEAKKAVILNDIKTLVDATDFIITDFCSEFGGVENAMPIIRHQFTLSGVSVVNPSRRGLLELVDRLANIERDFKAETRVNLNRNRRVAAVNKVGS